VDIQRRIGGQVSRQGKRKRREGRTGLGIQVEDAGDGCASEDVPRERHFILHQLDLLHGGELRRNGNGKNQAAFIPFCFQPCASQFVDPEIGLSGENLIEDAGKLLGLHVRRKPCPDIIGWQHGRAIDQSDDKISEHRAVDHDRGYAFGNLPLRKRNILCIGGKDEEREK